MGGGYRDGSDRWPVGYSAIYPPSTAAPCRWPWPDLARCARSLEGLLWILRTDAQWKDLPERDPPDQTCHRRFRQWVRSGIFEHILQALATDLRARGGLDLSESFIDGTFAVANKGGYVGKTKRGKIRRSWQWQTALAFLSPSTWRVLGRMKSPLLKLPSPSMLSMLSQSL